MLRCGVAFCGQLQAVLQTCLKDGEGSKCLQWNGHASVRPCFVHNNVFKKDSLPQFDQPTPKKQPPTEAAQFCIENVGAWKQQGQFCIENVDAWTKPYEVTCNMCMEVCDVVKARLISKTACIFRCKKCCCTISTIYREFGEGMGQKLPLMPSDDVRQFMNEAQSMTSKQIHAKLPVMITR